MRDLRGQRGELRPLTQFGVTRLECVEIVSHHQVLQRLSAARGNCRLLGGLGFAAEGRADTAYLWPKDRRSEPPHRPV